MVNTLPVSKFIQVSVTITPTAAQGPNLNSAMFVGDTQGVIDVTQRFRSYSGLPGVATDFGTTAPEYLGAQVFFAQNPQPTQLYVGFWAKAATPGRLLGGALTTAQQAMANFTPVTAGAFLVLEDGAAYAITGLNFSAQTNLNGVASTIQTALASAQANTKCVWNSNFSRFEFTSGTTGTGSSFVFLQNSTAVGSATFSGNPAPNDTITLNGSAITFVASGATGNQVNIGGTLALTLASLAALVNGSSDTQISKVTATVNTGTNANTIVYFYDKTVGTGGNSYTLARSSSAITLSGATLAGGVADTTTPALLVANNVLNNGAYSVGGIAAESALAGVQAIESVFSNWYGLDMTTANNNADVADSDHLAIAGYIEGDSNRHLYGLTTSEASALNTNDVTSVGALLKALGYNRTFYQWSSQNAYASCSIFGRGVTVNFNNQNSTITFMWKQEPGVVAENLNSTQSASLDANNYNYFAAMNNNTSITVNGTVASGHFIDEIWNSDWFGSTIQTAVYNLLFTTPTKIPQTDAGMNMIATTIESVCKQAVLNGFLAPGTWNSTGFGNIQNGSFLSKGYYIYTPPVASQSQADRAARKSVPFQVAAKEAGAVHDVQISVVVNQ